MAAELPEIFTELERSAVGAELALPRFETRFAASLKAAIQALGLTAPFEPDRAPGRFWRHRSAS